MTPNCKFTPTSPIHCNGNPLSLYPWLSGCHDRGLESVQETGEDSEQDKLRAYLDDQKVCVMQRL